jgi:hypothetical protein
VSGYLLDTSLVTAYLRGRAKTIALVSPWLAAKQAGTSLVVLPRGAIARQLVWCRDAPYIHGVDGAQLMLRWYSFPYCAWW